MDLWEQRMRDDFEHDRNAPWWKAKRHPSNLFEHAPIFFTLILIVWFVAAIAPGVAMLSKPVACALGASQMWCHEKDE